jgi:hypothetical protein
VTAPNPNGWQTTARGVATTVLLVAIALYVAVRLIEAVAQVLIALAAAGAFAFVVALIVHYRRSRW